jgi:hypothetical protein
MSLFKERCVQMYEDAIEIWAIQDSNESSSREV